MERVSQAEVVTTQGYRQFLETNKTSKSLSEMASGGLECPHLVGEIPQFQNRPVYRNMKQSLTCGRLRLRAIGGADLTRVEILAYSAEIKLLVGSMTVAAYCPQ